MLKETVQLFQILITLSRRSGAIPNRKKNSNRERHFVQTPKEIGQNFREIIKFGWGGNWHTSYSNYNCVCLWTLSGGFRGAHGPFCLGVVGVSGSAGEPSDITFST